MASSVQRSLTRSWPDIALQAHVAASPIRRPQAYDGKAGSVDRVRYAAKQPVDLGGRAGVERLRDKLRRSLGGCRGGGSMSKFHRKSFALLRR
jgi:hypothetical protein